MRIGGNALFALSRRALALTAGLVLAVLSSSFGQDLPVCEQLDTRTPEHPHIFAGRDGWVFTGNNLIDDIDFDPLLPYLDRLARALERQGTRLAIVVVPSRAMVHEDRLPNPLPESLGSPSQARARERYERVRSDLEEIGIIAPDILSAALELGRVEDFFFRLDHHWTPAGADAAAAVTAAAIRATGSAYDRLDKSAYETTRIGTTQNESSYRRIINEVCDSDLADEPLDRYRTALAGGGAAGLFADIPPEVVLIGTSFSRRADPERDFNFAGFLSQHLSLNVAVEAVAGGGAYNPLEAFLLDEQRVSPSFLVWEIPWAQFHPTDQVRRLVPAVAGSCDPEGALLEAISTIEPSRPAELIVRGIELPVTGAYLVLEFAERGVLDFNVTLEFEGGTSVIRATRKPRLQRHRRFFFDLPEFGGEILRAVQLRDLPVEAAGEVRMLICPMQ